MRPVDSDDHDQMQLCRSCPHNYREHDTAREDNPCMYCSCDAFTDVDPPRVLHPSLPEEHLAEQPLGTPVIPRQGGYSDGPPELTVITGAVRPPRPLEGIRAELDAADQATHGTDWFCDTAKGLVSGDRRATYGDALTDFTRTGRMWAAILGVDEVTPEQVALCMAALKLGRLCNTADHEDSWVDAIGYLALGGDIANQPGRHRADD